MRSGEPLKGTLTSSALFRNREGKRGRSLRDLPKSNIIRPEGSSTRASSPITRLGSQYPRTSPTQTTAPKLDDGNGRRARSAHTGLACVRIGRGNRSTETSLHPATLRE